MQQKSSLQKLTELATATSSERRRELLREVTDLYFANQNTCSTIENEHFDEILSHVTKEMSVEVRKEMALRFAPKTKAPLQLLRQLAHDDIDIAGPVLARSPILQNTHLCEVVATGQQPHMQAISTRNSLSADITRDLVKAGNDKTLIALAGNQGARFDRQSMQTMVDRSETVPDLQVPLVEHQDLPPDLMNEMYLFAEQKVRERILVRNQEIDPALLQEALSKVRQIASTSHQYPKDYQSAVVDVCAKNKKSELDGACLIRFERAGDRLRFTVGLAELAGIDYITIERVLQRADIDALALVCRAVGFDPAVFVTIVLLIDSSGATNTGDSAKIREQYLSIPQNAAQRTIRFWQMRQKLEAGKAA